MSNSIIRLSKENLKSLSRVDLEKKLLYLQEREEELLGAWERDYEKLHRFLRVVLRELSVLGKGMFDKEEEKKELQLLFDRLFCGEDE